MCSSCLFWLCKGIQGAKITPPQFIGVNRFLHCMFWRFGKLQEVARKDVPNGACCIGVRMELTSEWNLRGGNR